MNILKFLGALLYSVVVYYVMWLFFNWLTPYVMSISWGWFIVYLLIAGGAVSMFVASIASLIVIPLVLLSRECKAAKYAPVVFGLFFGFSSVRLPWLLDIEYGILQWILGVSFTSIILITFISLLVVPFKVDED